MLQVTSTPDPVASVIVPARNEEVCLGSCLESLVKQTGIDYEIIVVDDASTDRTAEIAKSFAAHEMPDRLSGEDGRSSTNHVGADALTRPNDSTNYEGTGVPARPKLTLISAPPLPENWAGKNNAMSAGAKVAKGKWLLFTDADTVHKPGSLARAVAEAEEHGAALLSYSPEQEVRTFWEKAVMPVIFAELAATYPPKKVNDPASPIAAANGQYLLISRGAYDAVGGHSKIAGDLLEDVALARLVKFSGRKIFFRYGGDAVRTRMYRSWPQMKEGWTKNLALLFRPAWSIASWRVAEFIFIPSVLAATVMFAMIGGTKLAFQPALLSLVVLFLFWKRLRVGHFSASSNLLAFSGLPVFAFLLVRSSRMQRSGGLQWKNRTYAVSQPFAIVSKGYQITAALALFLAVQVPILLVGMLVLWAYGARILHRH